MKALLIIGGLGTIAVIGFFIYDSMEQKKFRKELLLQLTNANDLRDIELSARERAIEKNAEPKKELETEQPE